MPWHVPCVAALSLQNTDITLTAGLQPYFGVALTAGTSKDIPKFGATDSTTKVLGSEVSGLSASGYSILEVAVTIYAAVEWKMAWVSPFPGFVPDGTILGLPYITDDTDLFFFYQPTCNMAHRQEVGAAVCRVAPVAPLLESYPWGSTLVFSLMLTM